MKKRTPEQLRRHREYMSEYRKTHHEYRERVNRRRCERQKLNREKTSKRWTEWRRDNAERQNKYNRDQLRKKRLQIIDLLGGQCECCGESEYEFLAIDHRNGDGNKHRKELTGRNRSMNGTRFCNIVLKELKFGTDRYRILCHNCNSAIGFYGSCPHKQATFDVLGVAC